jgi:sulfatase modifying factor 1
VVSRVSGKSNARLVGAGCAIGATLAAIAGCGQLIGLGNLHPREDGTDGGESGADADLGDVSTVLDGGSAKDGTSPPGDAGGNGNGDAGSTDAADATPPVEGGSCTPFTQTCAGGGIMTCSASGQWSAPWPCATGMCTAGACSGTTTTAPSCMAAGAGKTNCGPGGSGTESCCTSLEVPGGSFFRTYDPAIDGGVQVLPDGGPTAESGLAIVSGYRLDKYLVTVGRFRDFVSALGAGWLPMPTGGKHAHLNGGKGLAGSGGGTEPGWAMSDNANLTPTDTTLACEPTYPTWTNPAANNENLPINCVNWWEAYAFCIWDEGFLPSEAEWEYAAAGGSEQREYPWGNAAPGLMYAIYNSEYTMPTGSCPGTGCLAPVGTPSQGAARWGQLDLVGEVYEWALDYDGPFTSPCVDCADFTPLMYRSGRGGSFVAGAPGLRPPTFGSADPAKPKAAIGFRCARTP